MNTTDTISAGPCETTGCNTLCAAGALYCPRCVAARALSDLDDVTTAADACMARIAKLRAALADEHATLGTLIARTDAARASYIAAAEFAIASQEAA